MFLSLTVPSNASYKEKNSLAETLNKTNLGCFLSDLPQNHDLFQLIAIWKTEYPKISNIGTAIISPFVYDSETLIKQIKTLFEVYDSGIELGFGLGDKKLLNRNISNRIEAFENIISSLNQNIAKTNKNIFSIAGSGEKMISIANKFGFGLLYNGIINADIMNLIQNENTKNNVSSYIMTDINNYDNLSKGFITIVSRVLTGLSLKELTRLQIEEETIDAIKVKLQDMDYSTYQDWLPRNIVEKVSFFGSPEDIILKIRGLQSLEIKQVILSIVGTEKRNEFINYIQEHNVLF